VQLIANIEFWIAGLLLIASQIYRSSALRNLVSDVHVFRLRDIIGLNSAASLLNVVGPARLGDIFKFLFLARKGLGAKFAFLIVILERLFDLTVVLLFAITLKESRIVGIALFLGSLLALLIFVFLLLNFRFPAKYDFLGFGQVKHFLTRKDLANYFVKLIQCWLLTLAAASILNIKKEGFLLDWLNWNSKLGEPFTPLISRNQFLLGILLLPLIALLVSTVLLRNSSQVASHSLRNVARREDFHIENLERVRSEFSGSGCDIYTASGTSKAHKDYRQSIICKVEPKSRFNFLQVQADFMRDNRELFDFPKVFSVARTANFNLIVMENIEDYPTGLQSENYASIIRGASRQSRRILLEEVLDFLFENKLQEKEHKVAANNADLAARMGRVAAFCSIQGFHNDRNRIHGKSFALTLKEISRLLQQEFTSDIAATSHGDATLSNFIRQETSSGFRIRAIDPNPRIQIGRIEYDLGKIFQSVSSMYEETMHNPDFIDLGIDNFISRKSNNSDEAQLIDLIKLKGNQINLELTHLFHLTHLVRILPYQHRRGPAYVKYWQDVITYQFESQFK
jgi:hypothetical protein